MVQEAQRFGSVAGGVSRSGVRIGPPEEDAPLNPRPMRERRMQFRGLPQPYSPGGILPGLEGVAPMPDFSGQAGGDATGAMPPMPQERIQRPVYQEPEPPGKWRTALGIGLSGVANLAGQGPQAAQNFFLAPEARAEREYARELGAYSASQGEWSDYWDQIMQGQEIDIRERTLEENKRQFEEEGKRPIGVPRYGTLYNPTTEEVMFQDDRMPGADTQRGAQREQAIAYWLQAHPGRTRESMDAFEVDQAIEGRRRRRGEEPLVAGFDKDGNLVYRPRGEMIGQERPASRFDEFGNIIYQGQGSTGIRDRVPQITEEDIARVDEWMADEKRDARQAHLNAGLQLLAPRQGTPEYDAFEKALEDELLAIEAEGEVRKERLRSGTIEQLPGEGRVLQYNIRTGRAE